MAKKPSPAELKKQGEELGKQFAEMRKTEHNFAMQIGKEGLVFLVDRRKPADALWRIARKEGGSSKGVKGRLTMNGKIIELDCDDPDSAPTGLVKLAKAHFADRGHPARIIIKGVEDPEDDAEEPVAQSAVQKGSSGPQARLEEQEEIVSDANAGAAAATETPPEAGSNADLEASPEAPAAQSQTEQAEKELKQRFIELKPDIDACVASGNKGLAKKVGGLTVMFEAQVGTNLKKSIAILGLLKTTITTARDAGHLAPPTQPAPHTATDTALAARRSRIAELERGVDSLLAEFA